MKYNRILFGLVVALAFTACDDYLDLKPLSEETSANAYEKASQIEAALTGAYETFQSDHFIWNNLMFQDIRSDNHYAGGDNPEIFEMDWLTVSVTNSKVYGSWSNLYNGISKANLVIDKVDGVSDIKLTDKRRNQIKGEALFLRANYYYNLATLFGGVPIVLSTKSTQPEDVRIARSTEQEVYDQIMIDLDLAASLLPEKYGNDASVNKARATSGAANALAAKACAQMPSHNFAKTLEYIAKVESSSANYRLLNNYAELFDGNHYNNDESILEVQYLGGDEGNWGPQLLLPPSLSGDTWRKFVTPSHNLVDAFDAEGDEIRKNATVLMEAVDWVDEFWGNAIGSEVAFGYKWKNASGWASADRLYILRYGDIVLLKAEALNETGKLSESVAEVNKIRARAELPELTSDKTVSKEALRMAILNERRLELAQESQRWDDLVRHDLAVLTMQNLVEIDLRTNQAFNYNMTDVKVLLPIPQQEMDRNPSLVQNPL